MTSKPTDFGGALREYLHANGTTPAVVARVSQVNQSTVDRLLAGERPLAPTIQKIAVGLMTDIVFESTGGVKFQESLRK